MTICNGESNDITTSESENRMQRERTHSPTSVTRFNACPEGKLDRAETKTTHFDDESSTELYTDTTEQKASVRFERSVNIRYIRSVREYTPRQIKDCWYHPDELQDIRSLFSDELRKAEEQVVDSNDDSYCIRGLESHYELAHKQKVRLRSEAAVAVFNAQERGCNENQIAAQCSALTSRSQTWANVMGLRDQREATSIHDESRKPIFFF